MATNFENYEQTVVTAPGQPSTESMFDLDKFSVFIRELVAEGTVEEPTMAAELDSASSFFNGNTIIKDETMLRNLRVGQMWKLIVEKDQNPLGLVQKKEMAYNTIDPCHVQLDLDCEVPCINTLPEFDTLTFCFDTEYAYGVRACAKNTDFWDFGYFTKQYAKSQRAYRFVRELDRWNNAIESATTSPAVTVDAALAQVHPTHFWENLGTVTAKGAESLRFAYQYLVDSFTDVRPTTFVAKEFVQELIQSVELPYNENLTIQRVNTFDQWHVPGFDLTNSVKTILGTIGEVVVMRRSPWLTYANQGSLVSQYPLWNEDGSKQYVAMFDPRYSYSFEKEGFHLVINPYDCDKLTRGMIDTVYTGTGTTFPQYALVLEFDKFQGYAGGTVSA